MQLVCNCSDKIYYLTQFDPADGKFYMEDRRDIIEDQFTFSCTMIEGRTIDIDFDFEMLGHPFYDHDGIVYFDVFCPIYEIKKK